MCNYNSVERQIKGKEIRNMSGKKKSGKENGTLARIVFITAILNLIQAIIDLIKLLTE